jgi:Zn-dependent protease with chaperone function
MRASVAFPFSTAVGALLPCLAVALLIVAPSHAAENRPAGPLPAGGDAPAFLLASVQPIEAPKAWRRIYHEVEHCAGKGGDYDAIHWAVMEEPLRGPKGPTYAFTSGSRIVLVRGDTTYLRHEMLHHVLEVAGWHPRPLGPGEHYTIADLHPMPLFGLCTGGR